ncbi:acetyl-CoA synthetase-like protein [Byssothecium circinans]|uniref:Acetyl-CoA synthetase-like protein n=1 Tax=Byssothecium circinans TaxID=147558 RepID=A0A6A5T981_9PLEO|nr:acetyl-CoA synthetase-like protein [Byssothecium circinans]KAF1948289.1 acetyl-CoA synthetase-like protein [Byssothecium circinans]
MAPGLTPWPSTRNTLLVHQVDKIAKHHPETLYAVLPRSPDTVTDGFREVTYRHLGNAVNGIASWIERTLGKSEDGTFPTLTYFGPNDLRHAFLLLGAVKAGYKMLFPSPRYGAEPLAALIGTLGGTVMLVPKSKHQAQIVDQVLAHRQMSIHTVPDLDQLLDEQHQDYAYEKTFDDARSEPLVALHTSGTTGFPKPIIWTHDWADSFGLERSLEPPQGFESMDGHLLGTRVLSFMPPFHASGIFGGMFFSLCRGSVLIYPPSGVPPSAAVAVEMLRYTKADTLAMPAPFLEAIAAAPHILDEIASRTKVAMYAGGDLAAAAGDVIASKMHLFTACGSTEMGLWPILGRKEMQQTDRWHYMHFHPAMNVKMQRTSEAENIYEAVVERNEDLDGVNSYVQPIFKLFPHLRHYNTADLFTPHPSDPNLWQFYGRADDLQTFADGGKYHPVAVENLISQHPNVSEALLVGTGCPQAALLLRLREGGEGGLGAVWPTIQEANRMCPAYAVITRSLVYLVDASQPFPKTAKGTVQRKATAEMYKEELNKLFKRRGSGGK